MKLASSVTAISGARSPRIVPIESVRPGQAPGQNWHQMMAAAQQGDANAYRTLLAEVAVWLRQSYAKRVPPAMVEDATQDVLLAIHEKRHTYDPGRLFEPWLAAIVRYKWKDQLRSLKVKAVHPLKENIGLLDYGAAVESPQNCHIARFARRDAIPHSTRTKR